MWEKESLNQLYQSISRRKSVRKYEQTPLDKHFLEELMNLPLFNYNGSDDYKFKILNIKQIKGIIPAKAPHFIALYAKDNPKSIINGAFALQQIDLYLSSKGYGACWLGMPSIDKSLKEYDGLKFVILLAFGKPVEKQSRDSVSEFKRKTLSEITDSQNYHDILEGLRLAPSAVNKQPWFVKVEANKFHLFMKQSGMIVKRFKGDMPYVDMGIALCHLWLSSVYHNKNTTFTNEQVDNIINHHYICTVTIDE